MHLKFQRRQLLAASAALPLIAVFPGRTQAAGVTAADWPATLRTARGQTVYFNAWAGSERINAYLQWAGVEVEKRYGVKLEHVKISDTAEVVKRVRAEKQAGRNADGSVDAVWINGENFLAMRRDGLLFGPFAEALPSFVNVDTVGKPTTRIDFSQTVEGMEAPWGMAQLTFFADSKVVAKPPRSMADWVAYAKANPGRMTYPKPPNFHGTTFLKQMLLEASSATPADRAAFYQPVKADDFAKLSAPLWTALDAVHPVLWRQGKQFPASNVVMRQMLSDGELHINLTFNPNEAANEVAAKRLPDTVVSWQHTAGTLGNTHFLAIAYNARAKEGAQVLINFLMSPEAQARKANIQFWGDPTVLAVDRLPAAEKALFAQSAAPGSVLQAAPALAEPHASWVEALEREWLKRYGQ
jgi:putative thiamine transport system substrate-binding protein